MIAELCQVFNAGGSFCSRLALTFLWQSTILIVLASLVWFIIRPRNIPRLHHLLWSLTLILLLALPVISALQHLVHLPTLRVASPSVIYSVNWQRVASPIARPEASLGEQLPIQLTFPSPSVESSTPPTQRRPVSEQAPVGLTLPALFLLVWASVSFLLWLRWMLGLFYIRHLRTARQNTFLNPQQLVPEQDTRVLIVASPFITTPLIYGLLRPTILVPTALLTQLTTKQKRSILLHELAHWQQRDLWLKELYQFLAILFWFQPLLLWVKLRLSVASEELADQKVFTHKEALHLAHALRKTARFAFQRKHLLLSPVALLTKRNVLKSRVERLLNGSLHRKTTLHPFTVASFAICAVITLFMLSAVQLATDPEATHPCPSVSPKKQQSKDALTRAKELARELSDKRSNPAALTRINQRLLRLTQRLTPGHNLLSNCDFENGSGTLPDAWELRNGHLVELAWGTGLGYNNSKGVCIKKTAGKFPYASLVQSIDVPQDDALLQLSARVKSKNLGKAILDLLFLDEHNEWIYHIWVYPIGSPWGSGAHDWKQYLGYAYVPPGTKKIEVSLQMYWPGELWLDDYQVALMK